MKVSRYFFNGLIILFLALVLVSAVSKIFGSLFSKPETSSTATAPTPPPVKKLKLHCSFAQGSFVSHDVILSNTTGEDLSETKISIKVIGENAAPAISRYWAKWPLGEKQTISVPVSDVKNVQRIQVYGSTDQGDIDQQWTIQ